MPVSDRPAIYLTFDDGPHPTATPYVLDQLKQYNAKATFFCIGKNVSDHPNIYQSIISDGHTIANHTQNHLNGWHTKKNKYIANIEEAEKHIDSSLFRPPYGRITRGQINALNRRTKPYKIVMWDVLSGDFDTNISGEQCLSNVLSNIEDGSIVVFHDSQKAWDRMSYALPKVLNHCIEQNFVDTHTHLYDEQFNDDRTEAIQKAIDAGVKQMYLPNCNSETIDGMMELAKKFPANCYPMMGLHPCYVKEDYKQELKIVEEYLKNHTFSAVGEIGLDYYWDTTFKAQQIEAFETQIDWALQHDLPIVIHTRNSLQDGIDIVKKKQNGDLKGVFHCFGGSLQEAQQIVDLGFYLGIGGVVTFKNSKLSDTLKDIDLKHILLETDAPYLAPTPHRGKRNESSYIPLVAEKLVDTYQCTLNEIASITTENAMRLFNK